MRRAARQIDRHDEHGRDEVSVSVVIRVYLNLTLKDGIISRREDALEGVGGNWGLPRKKIHDVGRTNTQ